jgi:hypothetical protein
MDHELILAQAQQLSTMLDGSIESVDELGNLTAKLSVLECAGQVDPSPAIRQR